MRLVPAALATIALALLSIIAPQDARAVPTVSLTAPTASQTFGEPATITLTASATPSGGTTITKVEFFRGGSTLIGTKTSSPYTFIWSAVAAASYSLTAKATDSAAGTKTSTAVAITVRPPPTVSITAPANNATFVAPATIAITASATAASGGTISKVEFFNGAALIGTKTTSPYTFSWTGVAAGTYSLTAKATDSKAIAATSSAINVTVTPPQPPTLSITSPANNATFSPPATVAITATATPAAGATISKVEFFNGAALIGTKTTSPYTFSWTNVAAGSYSLTAKATDNKTANATSAPVAITVQTPQTPPTVSITSPASGTTFAGPAAIAITASAAATQSGATMSKVEFFNGPTLIGTIPGTGPYTFTWSGVSAGGYLLSAKATDSFGSMSTSSLVYAIVDGADSCASAPPLAAIEAKTKLAALGNLPLTFEANTGQSPSEVRFQLRRPGYQLYLTASESVLALQGAGTKAVAVRMQFVGAAPDPAIIGLERVQSTSNYLIGKDPTSWRANVPQYARVRYEGLYPGIDKVFYGSEGKLEYDLRVAPGSDPRRVKLAIEGIDSLAVDKSGDLLLETAVGTLVQKKPVAYQEIDGRRRDVAASYLVAANEVSFALGSYDKRYTLIIDPVLVYSTYLGATANSTGANTIAISRCGEVFVAGFTNASNYPTTAGAFDPSAVPGSQMGFVSKLNQSGTALVYSTFVTGTTADFPPQNTEVTGIAVDGTGHAYVTGNTSSTDFPTTPGSVNTAPVISPSGFVGKLNTDGSAFIYSTYMAATYLAAIAVDSAGSAYVTGNRGAWKVNALGSAMDYALLIGGSGNPSQGLYDTSQGIAVDSAGNAYVAGITYSGDLPVTAGAFQPTRPTTSTNASGFVAKIDPAGAGLVYGTYLGTAGNVYLYGIAIDSTGAAYVTGMTDLNASIPHFTGSYKSFNQNVDQAGNLYALVAKVKPDGSNLNYFSRIGGSQCAQFDCSYAQTFGLAIAVDQSGNAWVAGTTASNQMPLVKPLYAAFASPNNAPDIFTAKVAATGTSLIFSTLLNGQTPGAYAPNGPGLSHVGGIAVDTIGSVYIGGWTDKIDFPTTPGSYKPALASNQVINAFVAKINETKDTSTALAVSPNPGSVGTAQTLTASVSGNAPSGTVSFLDGTSTVGSAALSSGTEQLVTSQLAAGLHSLTASYGGDAHNNPSVSAPVSLNVANPTGLPTISISGISDGATLVTNAGGVLTGANVTVTANAAAGNNLTQLTIYFGGGSTIWTFNAPSITQPWTLPNLAPGMYVISAAALDSNGHSTMSAPIRFVVNSAGAAAPSVAITVPSNGATLSAPGPFTVTATATAAGSATISGVTFFAGASVIGNASSSPYTSSWSDATAGSYSLMALATDSAGVNRLSAPISVTVTSPPPPTVALTSPANSASFWTTDSIPLAATASGNGGATIIKVEFYGDGTLLGAVGAAPYSFAWTGANAGTHSITAKAYDSRNITTTSSAVSITVATPPIPTIGITSPASGASFTSPANIPITVNAAGGSGATVTRVDFYSGTSLIGTSASAPWGFTWSNVAAGSYSLTAKVIDSRSVTATSAAVTVTVAQGQVTLTLDGGSNVSVNDDIAVITGIIQAPPNSAVTVNGTPGTVTPDGRFFASGVRLQAGTNAFAVTVTTPDGDTATQNLNIASGGPGLFKVTVTPTQGLAPLDVAFTVENPSNTPFGTIEFDINGDGVADYTASSISNANPIFTLQAGYALAKVTVKAPGGSVLYTFTQPIYAFTPGERYRLMKGVYTGMVDRLKVGNSSTALNFFFGHARVVYEDIFNKLGPDLAAAAAQLGDVATINMSDEIAEIVILRDTPQGKIAFMVHLMLGEDGIWRIESM